jgi:hypothetical protein
MIPAFDLRLGNWVNIRGNNTYITAVNSTNVTLYGSTSCENAEQLHPIFLNDEILINAGFTRRNGTPLYDKIQWDGFSYHLPSHRILLFHKRDNMLAHWLETQIVFLHQLQNVFYYITGKEIIIQL